MPGVTASDLQTASITATERPWVLPDNNLSLSMQADYSAASNSTEPSTTFRRSLPMGVMSPLPRRDCNLCRLGRAGWTRTAFDTPNSVLGGKL